MVLKERGGGGERVKEGTGERKRETEREGLTCVYDICVCVRLRLMRINGYGVCVRVCDKQR